MFEPESGKDNLLASIRNVQVSRPNLVVYSRLIKGMAEVAWILKPDGARLKPTGFKDWLRSRGLFLECLCPLVLEIGEREPVSCRLVVSKTSGDVLAFCHQEKDGCGMRVNISGIAESSTRLSKYSHFTPNSSASAVPQMQKILHLYRAEGLYNHKFAPFLNGYIGEHIEFYQPGTMQLAGFPHPVPMNIARPLPLAVPIQYQQRYRPYSLPKTTPKLKYIEIDDFENPSCTLPSSSDIASFTTRLGEKSKAITSVRKRDSHGGEAVAGSSRLEVISVSSSDSFSSARAPSSSGPGPGGPSCSSSSIRVSGADGSTSLQLRRLQTGQGLAFEEWMSICSRCPECDKYFLQGKFFEEHEKMCFGLDI